MLDAALDLFAEQGYANTSIEQICQTAYVGTKSFYELFDSKEACYLALLERTSQAISERVVTALDEAPDDERTATHLLLSRVRPRPGRRSPHRPHDVRGRGRHLAGDRAPATGQPAVERGLPRGGVGPLRRGHPETAAARRSLHRLAVGTIGGLFDLVVDWLHDTDGDDTGGTAAEPDVDALIDDLTAFYGVVRAGLADRRR